MIFNIQKDYYIRGEEIFNSDSVEINKGITVLVGKNGIGKSTMIKAMKDYLDKNNKKYISFDKVFENNRHNEFEMSLLLGDLEHIASRMELSEGQDAMESYSKFVVKIGRYVRKSEDKELFVFIDALDSGLDIINIQDISSLFDFIVKDADKEGKDVYIIVSTNNYEFTVGRDCVFPKTCEHIKFSCYKEYKDFILSQK